MVNCWNYIAGNLQESLRFSLYCLPLTLTPINTTALKWWTNIHKALTEALKIIYHKSERTIYHRK